MLRMVLKKMMNLIGSIRFLKSGKLLVRVDVINIFVFDVDIREHYKKYCEPHYSYKNYLFSQFYSWPDQMMEAILRFSRTNLYTLRHKGFIKAGLTLTSKQRTSTNIFCRQRSIFTCFVNRLTGMNEATSPNPKMVNLNRNVSSVTDQKENKGPVIVENIDAVRLIGINRPEKRNCVNSTTAAALLQAFQDFDKDPDSRVAVLHGVGGNFCAGYDLDELSSTTDFTAAANIIREETGPMGVSRYETSKPVIAAVSGYAVAGGLELALWCDLRIMEETAVMGVFCRRFGVPLIDGGTVRLPMIVGLGRAMDIILTGRPVRAPEALQIGLATHVVPCGCALGRAVFVAEGLLRYPQAALMADRNSARKAFSFSSLKDALVNEHRNGLPSLGEAQIGATSFVKGTGRHGSFDLGDNDNEGDSPDKGPSSKL